MPATKKTVATGRESDKFMLRLPGSMRASLKTAAADNRRTLNAEIIARLSASFEPAASIDPKLAALIAEKVEAAVIAELNNRKVIFR